jgi:hypothetical protein
VSGCVRYLSVSFRKHQKREREAEDVEGLIRLNIELAMKASSVLRERVAELLDLSLEF